MIIDPFQFVASGGGGDITSNLELWWKLDNGSGTTATDSGSGGTNGSLMNDFSADPSWTSVTAMIGTNCLTFGGANTNWVQNTTGRTLTGAITIAAWVRYTGGSNLASTAATFRDNTNGIGIGFRVGQGGNANCIIVVDGAATAPTRFNTSASTWYHVVAVYSGGTLVTSYVNGVSFSTAASATLVPGTNDNGVQMGCDRLTEGHQLSGSVDDLRLYRRAFVQADVDLLFAYR